MEFLGSKAIDPDEEQMKAQRRARVHAPHALSNEGHDSVVPTISESAS